MTRNALLVSRAASRPEMIFLIAGTLTGNGGRPLQTLQEICRASEVTEATGPVPGFWRRFARRFRRRSNDDWLIIFIRHQHGRKFRRLSSMIEQSYTVPIRVKPLRNGVFVVIHPYPEKNDCDDAIDLEMPGGDECIQSRRAGLIDSSPKISPAAGSTSPPPRSRPAQARPDNNVFAREFRMGGSPFLPCFD